MKARLIAIALLVSLAWPQLARVAQAQEDADRRRALVLLRVLAYDRHLKARAGDKATILVVSNDKQTVDERDRWLVSLAAARKIKVAGLAIVTRTHDYVDETTFNNVVREMRPAAIVVCGGLGPRLPAIRKAARTFKAMTFTTRAAEVEAGFAAGIISGERRDTIVVNVAAAQAEGVQFEAGLLQIAQRVGVRP